MTQLTQYDEEQPRKRHRRSRKLKPIEVVRSDCGDRLDAALTADRRWRREREAALDAKLQSALDRERWAREVCGISSAFVCVAAIVIVLVFAGFGGETELLSILFLIAAIVMTVFGLLYAGFAAALMVASARRRVLLANARRNEISVVMQNPSLNAGDEELNRSVEREARNESDRRTDG